MTVTLHRWSEGDLPVLQRANTPEMTRFLGGPETDEQVLDRHERYLQYWRTGEAWMYRVDVDGEPAGGIGYWKVEHDGADAWETGWEIEPKWQGQGVARSALQLLIRIVAADGSRSLLVAYPGVDNAGSNALCRGAGFSHVATDTMPWRGGELTFNTWVLDMAPLDLDGRQPDVDERFADGLDESRWWPFYNPHWSSRADAAARWSTGSDGLELRIDEDTRPWAPAIDGDIRVSHVQTGQFSGPLGSGIGQHRFRPGLAVTEEQPEHRGWLAHFGVIEVRMAAIAHADAMVAFWPIGFEEHPDDCGEICIAEIFGNEIDGSAGLVGIGVKPQNDPRLRLDFEKIRVEADLTAMHDYAVEWMPDRLRFFVDGRWVKTVAQAIDYPVQFMLDVYEFARDDGHRDVAALPHILRVERVRTYPPVDAPAGGEGSNPIDGATPPR